MAEHGEVVRAAVRTRADLVHAFQAIASSGKPYRLTVKPEEEEFVVVALRRWFQVEAEALAATYKERAKA